MTLGWCHLFEKNHQREPKFDIIKCYTLAVNATTEFTKISPLKVGYSGHTRTRCDLGGFPTK